MTGASQNRTSIKKPEFPGTIKEGYTTAVIYKYANRVAISCTVVRYEGEVRKWKVYATTAPAN